MTISSLSDQLAASDPTCSVWVGASAGTGKTKVLTDRVLRILLSGTPHSRILCITYTRAAAAEMEERILSRLGEWAIGSELDLERSIAGLTGQPATQRMIKTARGLFALVVDSAERMRIQTIHGFCQSVLSRFPLEAGVAPNFSAIDERTSAELLGIARERLFLATADNPACAHAFREITRIVSETTFNELIASILRKAQAFDALYADPQGQEKLAVRIVEKLDCGSDRDEASIVASCFTYTDTERGSLLHACRVLSASVASSDLKTGAALSEWLAGRLSVEEYIGALLTDKQEPRKRLFTKEMATTYPPITDLLAAEQVRAVACNERVRAIRIAAFSHHVAEIARALVGFYREQKRIHNYLDYDDLIHYTVRLFYREGVAAWVLYKLDGGIDHLLLDEAQDTSPGQWKLIHKLAEEFYAGESARAVPRTLFVVGDEKQSIFSFQGARPQAFDRMQREVARRSDAGHMPFRRVRLTRSFRSAAPVLKAVDQVFAQASAHDGVLFTEKDVMHDVHREGAAGRVELWPLDEPPDTEASESWRVADRSEYTPRPERICAERIARTIHAWLAEGRILPSQNRPVRPGDILILVQRRNIFADYMLRALKRLDIPVAGADRLVLTDHIAVQDCLALADFLLLPEDDLTLAALLKSPFIGISEEELFTLAYDRGTATLWQRLQASDAHPDAVRFLCDLLAATDYLSPYELFVHALDTLGGRKRLLARLGEECQDPLSELLNLALEYDYRHPSSLQGFLHWLRGSVTQIKRDMEKGRGEVRIMTVHGAKGLQAPIVFMPDTTRLPRVAGNEILWLEEDDPAQAVLLWSGLAAHENARYKSFRRERRTESEREYRRLLYVAMTRAEDELYICGWKGAQALSPLCWYELIRAAATSSPEWSDEDGIRRIESAQTRAVEPKESAEAARADLTLPAWASSRPPEEPSLPQPLSPSRLDDEQPGAAPFQPPHLHRRGLLLHRLLQYIPELPPASRHQAASRLIARDAPELPPDEALRLVDEAMKVVEHSEFGRAFLPPSLAEVPITGTILKNGEKLVISGRIDRLCVTDDEVYIIDYKTGRSVPDTVAQAPPGYLRQMDAYRALVQGIYPGRKIRCALLWTSAPKWMALD